MYGGCNTCKLLFEENCKGCLWDDKAQRNTHWEQKEPFINKPCVSEQACREDTMKVLEKIRAEIENVTPKAKFQTGKTSVDVQMMIPQEKVFRIIDKYIKESEDTDD